LVDHVVVGQGVRAEGLRARKEKRLVGDLGGREAQIQPVGVDEAQVGVEVGQDIDGVARVVGEAVVGLPDGSSYAMTRLAIVELCDQPNTVEASPTA